MKSALDYARAGCNTLMEAFAPEALLPEGKFHYHQGVFLSGMERTYLLCREEKYAAYLKRYVDHYIDSQGNVSGCDMTEFDDLQPAVLLFGLYQKTRDPRYQKVLDQFADAAEKWPKNAKGGFWHKYRHKNQMWLDTLYMIGPFLARYAVSFDAPYFYEIVYQQVKIMTRYMRDEATGLMYHGWDDSRRMPWADPQTGKSPCFWGRAAGWFAVALAEIIPCFPAADPRRAELCQILSQTLEAVVRVQDGKTGRWYQVLDRGGAEGNWLETSASCLFACAMAKAMRLKMIPPFCQEALVKAYGGVLDTVVWDEKKERIFLQHICTGTCVGDFDYYVNRKTAVNDLHGMGAFVLMCAEYALWRRETAQ